MPRLVGRDGTTSLDGLAWNKELVRSSGVCKEGEACIEAPVAAETEIAIDSGDTDSVGMEASTSTDASIDSDSEGVEIGKGGIDTSTSAET